MFRILNLILVSLISFNAAGQNSIIERVNDYLDSKYAHENEILYVSIKEQKLYHIQNNSIIKEYIISSSAYGIGSEAGSNKTPIGLHRIAGKF